LLDPQRLPAFEWNGRTARSTTGALRAIFEAEVHDIDYATFVTALNDVLTEQHEQRERDLREVPCEVRFTRTLIRAGLPESTWTLSLAQRLAATHNLTLAGAARIPSSHADFLRQASGSYPLALVSNFDHGPTARELLRIGAVSQYFRHMIISVEDGFRKPHPEIFRHALAALGVKARRALFVGDTPEEDLVGAKQIGMDVAWVNPEGSSLPAGVPKPDYVIASIGALQPILLD
jgi:FMN phosphatase YigB (HAD superfamily)